MNIKKLIPWVSKRPSLLEDTALRDQIEISAGLQEEVQQLKGELARATEGYHNKANECNTKAQELSGFLYTLASKELTVSAFDSGDHSYRFDVSFRPNLRDPADQYLPYDCEYQGHQKVFSRTRIEELIRVVLQVGLDQWQAIDSSFGFHIKRRFTSEGIYTLAESIKAAENQLQRLVNELHRPQGDEVGAGEREAERRGATVAIYREVEV